MTRLHEERGFAMITAVLVSMVILSLSLVVVSLSLHNTGSSGRDRDRVQAVNAAEAGIDGWFSGLTKSTGAAICSSTAWDGNLPTTPQTAYDVTVTLYSTWPPVPGTEIPCVTPLAAAPLGALIVSKGRAVTVQTSATTYRTMESEVRLVGLYSGFNKAIFSDTGLGLQNQLTLNGYQGNDGDVYTNGNFTLSNNTVIAGSAFAQGYIDIAQGVIKQDVWGNGYVNMTNGMQVFGNATSSTSYISLSSNSTVFGNAKAGTTISGGTIKGTLTPNSPSGTPPALALPQLKYDAQAWKDPDGNSATLTDDYTVVNYTSCILAQAFINSSPVGNYAVRITPACALSWGNNSVVNLKGNLAIITDGSISTLNQTNWNSIGGPWTVFFIRPYPDSGTLNCSTGTYNITVSNNTSFNNGTKVFVYSPCTVNFGNNNANGVNGQIIGGTVNITNQMILNYTPIQVPNFNVSGYTANVSYLREIPNG
jgi:Tfp pilus assembly protein PilV